MLTNSLMIILLTVLTVICLWDSKYKCQKEKFFDIKCGQALRGIFCLIVVLVHVPLNYQNRIQDMIGSFAYVGVTYYFMISSYGLKYSFDKKTEYFKLFWLKRIPKLLIPIILINLLITLWGLLTGNYAFDIKSILYIDEWVRILILFYFAFWLIYKIPFANGRRGWCWQDLIICGFVLVCSLLDKLTPIKITSIWPTESIGFVWGIVLYDSIDFFQRYVNKKWLQKTSIMFVLAVVLGLIYLKFKSIYFWGDYCLKIILGEVLLILILCIMVRVDISNRINLFLGRISYEVYLLHGYIFSIVRNVGKDTFNSGIYIWISIIVTIILAFVVNVISNWIYIKYHCFLEMCYNNVRIKRDKH